MTPIRTDELFDLIRNERRRLAVQYLDQHDEPVELARMAEWISAHQHDCAITELDAAERKRAYIPLYQNHLPKLKDKGVIEMPDGGSRIITSGPAFEQVRDAIIAVERSGDPQPTGPIARVRGFFGGVADV